MLAYVSAYALKVEEDLGYGNPHSEQEALKSKICDKWKI